MLAKMRLRLPDSMPLIGVGGVHNAETAFQKMEAGANLVQLYSGMVYGGPGLPAKILMGLSKLCAAQNISSISDIVGREAENWARFNS